MLVEKKNTTARNKKKQNEETGNEKEHAITLNTTYK